MATELFPALVHICTIAAIAIGGARLLWLFLSPVPAPAETVLRPRLLSIGRFSPLLVIFGCIGIVGFVAITLWLKSAPSGWWNLFPFLMAYALGGAGAGAILIGITTQSTLVDAYRGFDLEADTGNLQRNLDAALVLAFGMIMWAAMNFGWLPKLDWSTATLPDVEQRELVIRAPIYFAIMAALIRTYYGDRGDPVVAEKTLGHLKIWGGLLFFIAFDLAVKGVLPRNYEIERYVKDHGAGISLLGIESPATPPPDLSSGEICAILGLSLVMTMAATTLVDMAARRGRSSAYIPRRLWPAGLFLCLALLSSAAYGNQTAPHDSVLNWIGEIAAPLAIGMMLARAFPLLWNLCAKARRFTMKTAARGLLAQLLIFSLLLPLSVAVLYAASTLTAVAFVAFLVGGIAAAVLGLLRLPASAPDVEPASAAST